MKLFSIPTEIHLEDSFERFSAQFQLGPNDLVLTNEILFDKYMIGRVGGARAIYQERYGMGEPNDEMINAILASACEAPFARVIAVGGGTVLDIAKLLVLDGVTDVVAAFERKVPIARRKGLIAVPTTCGTGSEVTMISIAELRSKKTKMGLADPALFPDHAVLIPQLLEGLPYKVFITSAIDALVHAVESYVSPKANAYTQALSLGATRTILDIFRKMAERGLDYRASRLSDVLVAANQAGVAFGNAGVGAVHALAYPLGGVYHVPHGEANFACFAGVFRAYQTKQPSGASLVALNRVLCDCLGSESNAVYDDLDTLLGKLIEKKPLRAYGMTESDVESFADSVVEKQQRLLANNYVALTRDEIRDIYRSMH